MSTSVRSGLHRRSLPLGPEAIERAWRSCKFHRSVKVDLGFGWLPDVLFGAPLSVIEALRGCSTAELEYWQQTGGWL
jgi:hypothetical protein